MASVSSERIIIQCINGEKIPISAENFQKINHLSSMIDVDSAGSNVIRLEVKSEQAIQLLSFLEGKGVQFTSLENCFDMYKFSKMYYIEELQNVCRKYIIREMEASNVCRIYDIAVYLNDTTIQYYCWKLFDLAYDNILKSDEFLRCSENIVMRLVSRPIYHSMDELWIFYAVCNWAITKNNERKRQSLNVADVKTDNEWIRSYMEPFLPMIRFLAMETKDLYQHVFPKNILNDKEISEIRFYKTNGRYDNYPETLSKCTIKRIPENKHFWYNYRNRPGNSHMKEILLNNSHKFQCDIFLHEDCFLLGLSLPISHQNTKGIAAMINILDPISKTIAVECSARGDISFRYPPLLSKNCIISIHAKIHDYEITERNRVKILEKAKFYISEEEAKNLKSDSSWKKFSFDPKLYF